MNIVGDSSQEKIGQPMKTLGFVETKKNADFTTSYLCQSDAAAASGLDIRSVPHVVNINQIFPSHDAIWNRFCKTPYYRKQPAIVRPSLAFTNVAVD